MNEAKCPYCGVHVNSVVMERIIVKPNFYTGSGGEYGGVSYACSACRKVLSVSIDPIALKHDLLEEISEIAPQSS